MSQRSITSFFTRKPEAKKADIKGCEESSTKNTCDKKEVNRSPSPAKSGKRKRNQVIYSSDEEETEKVTSTKSPAKKKVNGEVVKTSEDVKEQDSDSENATESPKENSRAHSPLLDFFRPPDKPIRKTAPRTLPPSDTLSPGIRKVLEEQESRKRKLSPEGDKRDEESFTEDFKPLPKDGEKEDNSDTVSPNKTSKDSDKDKSKSPKDKSKSECPTSDDKSKKTKSSSKTSKMTAKKKQSPKSKLSMFKNQKSKSNSSAKHEKEEGNTEGIDDKTSEIESNAEAEEKSSREEQVAKEENGSKGGEKINSSKYNTTEFEKMGSPSKKKEIHPFFGKSNDEGSSAKALPKDEEKKDNSESVSKDSDKSPKNESPTKCQTSDDKSKKTKSSSKTSKKTTKKKQSPKTKLSMFKNQSTSSPKYEKEEDKTEGVDDKTSEVESNAEAEEKSVREEQDTKGEKGSNEEKENNSPKTNTSESEKLESSSKKKEIHAFFGKKKDKDGKAIETPPDPGASYDPSKSRYHPIDDAFWKYKDKVPYLALARTMEEIENVSARLKMIEILSNYLRSVIVLSPDDLLPSVYLCLNKLAPAYHSLELGVAETTLLKAIAQSTGRSMAQIKSDAAAAGDLGIVAEQSRSTQRMMFKPAPLTVRSVFDKLKEIAQMTGQASMGKKVDKIQSMFVACRFSEARFLIRSLAGKLRIGLAEQSVLQALALACVSTPPAQEYPPEKIDVARCMSSESFKARLDEEALIIKTTYCECPNYDLMVPVILKEGVRALPEHCRLTPGIPLKPMLAHPTKGVSEVLQRFDGLRFTCEWKYDGERAQIHLNEEGKVSVYSRNQEDNTSKYPDIISRLASCLGPAVKTCVLDTEAVAWDMVNKRIQPFQVLSTRKKKDCVESEIKVQVCVFMFDLLYLNGESLVKKPLIERRALLREHFCEVTEQFEFATNLDTSTLEEVQEFLEESVKGNCEGLMVKTLETDATYEIAKRSRNWLKLKKDYLDGVGDTLDLVVIGGYLGRGKRAGLYGGFLLACYNPDTEEYQSVCKIGTGFSDEALQKHSESLKELLIPSPRPYYRYDTSHLPDHWFDATQVWEVKCADLSLSPVHQAAIGIVEPDKGISLRFPRFVRIREDKQAEEATSAQQVADMYKNQDQIKNQHDSNKIAEEDFY